MSTTTDDWPESTASSASAELPDVYLIVIFIIICIGAEEMVETLTTKCLDLEDKYNIVYEEKADLENLHEMDEELQENARELELELREDLDLANGKIRELERSREVAQDVIKDHEATISKFRDLVHKVQDQNAELRKTLENKKPEAISTMEIIDFKKMMADTKAFSKAIGMILLLFFNLLIKFSYSNFTNFS